MTAAVPPRVEAAGSAGWVRQVLAARWGPRWSGVPVRPLSAGDTAPLSHTAGLWYVERPEAGYVLKVQLNPDAAREPRFYPLKEEVLAHCRGHGVPAPAAVAASDGATSVWHDGLVCELAPLAPGAASGELTPAQAAAVVRTGLGLRRALDRPPGGVADRLAPIRLPRLVDEEHWPSALRDAEERLLPLAERRGDSWGRAAASALRGVVASGRLLREAGPAAAGERPARPAVVHGDLHYHHFLFSPTGDGAGEAGGPDVVAVLDFDNLHVGDRLLDLAWLAEMAGRVAGETGRRRSLAAFRQAATAAGLLAPGEERLLMPLLMAHSLPVIVDIAKDILLRDILSPAWTEYFDLLASPRRLRIHQSLVSPLPR
ncbi:phosphotransferase [Streptomyces sp. NPDC019937]|uniref:phosphotransferase n=1 Tax=Streptomyces sp. NPDC019937 TaxID=3154787 RepID=UPI0033D596F4